MFLVEIPAGELLHQGRSVSVAIRRDRGLTEVSQNERNEHLISHFGQQPQTLGRERNRRIELISPRLTQGQKAITNPYLGFYRMGSGVLDQFDNIMLDGIDVGI